jgi:predicted component of type VI protein secretion system
MFNLQRILLITLLQFLLLNCFKLEFKLKPFEKEKTKIENEMNSMRLGNYLRKLMLKVIKILNFRIIIY